MVVSFNLFALEGCSLATGNLTVAIAEFGNHSNDSLFPHITLGEHSVDCGRNVACVRFERIRHYAEIIR